MRMEQERRKLKISIFDIVIVAVVLVVAAAVFVILKPDDTAVIPGSSTSMEYTVEVLKMPAGTTELVQPGDKLLDGLKNYAIGTVVSAEAVPYTFQVVDEDTGVLKNAVMDRYENILITVEANMNTGTSALTTESGFVITVGTQVTVAGPCYSGVGYVISIERGE